MPLSERDKQTITYTITGHIDGFQVRTTADFPNLILALNSILTHSVPPDSVPLQMLEKIQAVRDYLDPDFMAVAPANRAEFMRLVYTIIGEIIARISRMTPADQAIYIAEQERHRGDVASSRERMERQRPPEGEARAVMPTDEDMRRVHAAGGINHPLIRPLIDAGILSMQSVQEMTALMGAEYPLLLARIINHTAVRPLVNAGSLTVRDIRTKISNSMRTLSSRVPPPTTSSMRTPSSRVPPPTLQDVVDDVIRNI